MLEIESFVLFRVALRELCRSNPKRKHKRESVNHAFQSGFDLSEE